MDDNTRSIDFLRTVLDRLDDDIITAIEDRRNVSRELGDLKGHSHITNAEQFEHRRRTYWERLGNHGARIYTEIHTDSSEIQKQ